MGIGHDRKLNNGKNKENKESYEGINNSNNKISYGNSEKDIVDDSFGDRIINEFDLNNAENKKDYHQDKKSELPQDNLNDNKKKLNDINKEIKGEIEKTNNEIKEKEDNLIEKRTQLISKIAELNNEKKNYVREVNDKKNDINNFNIIKKIIKIKDVKEAKKKIKASKEKVQNIDEKIKKLDIEKQNTDIEEENIKKEKEEKKTKLKDKIASLEDKKKEVLKDIVKDLQNIFDNYYKDNLENFLSPTKEIKKMSDVVEIKDDDFFDKKGGIYKVIDGYCDGKKCYIRKNCSNIETVIMHEYIHYISANDTNTDKKRGIRINGNDKLADEALTELFTKKIMNEKYPSNYDTDYKEIVKIMQIMEVGFGEEKLKKAYFQNDPSLLKENFDEYLGNNRWEDFSKAIDDSLECRYNKASKKAYDKAMRYAIMFCICKRKKLKINLISI